MPLVTSISLGMECNEIKSDRKEGKCRYKPSSRPELHSLASSLCSALVSCKVNSLTGPVNAFIAIAETGTGLYRAGTSPSRLYSGLFLPLERLITAGYRRES